MLCNKCGTENPDGAVFCGKCGKRIDGKIVCPACGTLNPEENNFCNVCGKKLNAKKICPDCGTEFEGNYCPQCGRAEPAPVQAATPVKPKRESTGKWRKIVEIVGGAMAMASVFFALLFTFFIGVNAQSMGIAAAEGVDLFYYFGKSYQDVADTLSKLTEYGYSGDYEFSCYIPAIMGTFVAAASIVSTLVFAILALVRYIRKVTGKSEKDFGRMVAATFSSYLASALSFFALHAMGTSQTVSGVRIVATTVLNPATAAGISLSAIFLAAFVGCRISVFGKTLATKQNLMRIIFSGAGVLLVSLALGFASGALACVSDEKTSVFSGYMGAIEYIRSTSSSALAYTGLKETAITIVYLAFVGQFVQIALIALLAVTFARYIGNLCGGKYVSNLGFAIPAMAVADINLAFVLVTGGLFHENIITTAMTTMSYAAPIAAMVFATLLLALSIVHTVLKKSAQKQAEQTVNYQ